MSIIWSSKRPFQWRRYPDDREVLLAAIRAQSEALRGSEGGRPVTNSTLTAARRLMAERDEARADAERLAGALATAPCMRMGVPYMVVDCIAEPSCTICRALATYREKKEA